MTHPKLTGYQTLIPAYGRSYHSPKEAQRAFLDGKDFVLISMIHGEVYCSVRDFAPGAVAKIRFDRDWTKLAHVTVR